MPQEMVVFGAGYESDQDYLHLAGTCKLLNPAGFSLKVYSMDLMPSELRAMCCYGKKDWSNREMECTVRDGHVTMRTSHAVHTRPYATWYEKYSSAPNHGRKVNGTGVCYSYRTPLLEIGDYSVTVETFSEEFNVTRCVPKF